MGPEVELLKHHRQIRADAQHLFWICGPAVVTAAFPSDRFPLEQDLPLLAVLKQVATAQQGGFSGT